MCLILCYKSYLSPSKILCPMSGQQNDCSLVSVKYVNKRITWGDYQTNGAMVF